MSMERPLSVIFVLLAASITRALASDLDSNDPMTPVPLPAQVPAKEGIAELPSARLGYWDTGGEGAAILLLHPATGSALIWGYQRPVFAAAGYRVIAYSRRGHHNSAPVPTDNPGTAVADLHNLVGYLGVGKFHVVGSAAGCSVAIDYALSHPERLLSMTLSSGIGGVRDPDYLKMSDCVRMASTPCPPSSASWGRPTGRRTPRA
jgi:pimeloyl-ACP methyl ester carboxylesterase